MRIFLSILTLLFVVVTVDAQKSDAFKAIGTIDIASNLLTVGASNPDNVNGGVYLSVVSATDVYATDIILKIPYNDLDKFVEFIRQAYTKYVAWNDIATDNSVKQVLKVMPVTVDCGVAKFSNQGKVYTVSNFTIEAVYFIDAADKTDLDDIPKFLVITSADTMVSLESSDTTLLDFLFAFSTPYQVMDFLTLIDKESIKRLFNKEKDINSLFL